MTPEGAPSHEQTLSTVYGQLRRSLLAGIRRRVHDPQLAEDLLQDVFVKALRSLREGKAPGNLPAWLHQVVNTTVADHYRGSKLMLEPLDEEPAGPEPEDNAAFQALATCMRPLVATLPPLYRDALLAADFKDQRLATLALAAGVSVSAIKSRVSRGRALLRARLLACCTLQHEPDGGLTHFAPRAEADCACAPRSGGPATPACR